LAIRASKNWPTTQVRKIYIIYSTKQLCFSVPRMRRSDIPNLDNGVLQAVLKKKGGITG
jgi:hypothetical protein